MCVCVGRGESRVPVLSVMIGVAGKVNRTAYNLGVSTLDGRASLLLTVDFDFDSLLDTIYYLLLTPFPKANE